MKRSILIILGKIIAWIGKRLGRGSTLPGQLVLKFEQNMLKKVRTSKSYHCCDWF